MIDACRKIYKLEGITGLYRGFWISSIQIISGVFYVSTYEGVRHLLTQDTPLGRVDSKVKALIAGGAASLVGQTIVVPFDVLSQHLMVLGINSTKHGRVYVDKVTREISVYLPLCLSLIEILIVCTFFVDGNESVGFDPRTRKNPRADLRRNNKIDLSERWLSRLLSRIHGVFVRLCS